MAFEVVLDPAEVAINRTELHLNDHGTAIQIQSVDWGDAAIQTYLGDIKYGSRKIDFRVPNRQVVVTLVIGGDNDPISFEAARMALHQKVGLLQQKFGWLKRQDGMYADIVNATLHEGDTYGETGAIEPAVVLTLECLPDFYGDEVQLVVTAYANDGVGEQWGESGTGRVEGDYPGRVRIYVPGNTDDDHRHLLWGWRSEYLNLSDRDTTARLQIEAEEMLPMQGSTVLPDGNARSGITVEFAPGVPGQWVSMLSTELTPSIQGYPTAAADASGVGTVAWTSVTDCINGIPDSTNVILSAGATSHYLEVTGLGFAIPTTATIMGIQVNITGKSALVFAQDAYVRLIKGGTVQSYNNAVVTNWPRDNDDYRTYGGLADVSPLWGTTWAPSDINASNFGVAFSVLNTGGTTETMWVSQIAVTIYYRDSTNPQHLTHVGVYRVFARAASTDGTPQIRLLWSAGGAQYVANDPVQLPPPIGGAFSSYFLADLGEIRIDPQPIGTPRWMGVIQTMAANTEETLIDSLLFAPVAEGGGQLLIPVVRGQVSAHPASQTIITGATVADDGGSHGVGTVAWTGLTPALSLFEFTTGSPEISHYLTYTNLGLTVPSAATITGIQLQFGRLAINKTRWAADYRIRLIKAGTIQTPDRARPAATWTTNPETEYYGGITDLWGGSWNPSDVNASNFGVAIAAQAQSIGSGSAGQVGLSYLNVTVYYTLGSDYSQGPDAVVYKATGGFGQAVEVRTDGVWRTDPTGTKWGPFTGEIQGDLPRIPTSGIEGRSVQLFLRRSPTDMTTVADAIEGTGAVVVKYRPCYLARPSI